MCKQLMAPWLAVLASTFFMCLILYIAKCQLFQFTGSDKESSGDPFSSLLPNDYGNISGQGNHVTTEKSASSSTLTTIKNLDTTKNNAGITPSIEIVVDDDFGFGGLVNEDVGEFVDQDFARITTINPRFL